MKKHFGKILTVLLIVALILIYLIFGLKYSLICLGVFSSLMFLNITLTTLTNTINGTHKVDDTFWKILFIIMASISIGIANYF